MGKKCSHDRLQRLCSMCADDLHPLFESYRYKAQKKGRDFRLTFDEFQEVIKQKCSMCGTLSRPRGIDREENSIHYTLSNVTAMCWPCNKIKKENPRYWLLEHIREIQRYQDQCSPEFQRMNELLEERDKRIEELETELAAKSAA